MNRTFRLGKVAGLPLMVRGNALVGWLVLWLVFAAFAFWVLGLPLATAVLSGFLALVIHCLNQLWHCLSHALAAWHTGYPMSGIAYRWVVGATLYPPDEPELPATVHIRRALGGPIGNLLLALLLGGLSLVVRPFGGLLYGLTLFAFGDNLLFFTLGAMTPLGFTDGTTLLKYWGQN